MSPGNWFQLKNPDLTDSPALLIYLDRIHENIRLMIKIAGDAKRMIPHIKTHKMPEVVKMQMQAGIYRFKCATIAEAEMLATAGVDEVVLAYQLNTSKAFRFLQLIKQYPHIRFASLVDNMQSAQLLNDLFMQEGLTARVYIDIDDGMHRTGFGTGGDMVALYEQINSLPKIQCLGFHVYDGHFHDKEFTERKELADAAIQPVMNAVAQIQSKGLSIPEVIAGGSPTFTVHALNLGVKCSPGTCLLWDWGYSMKLAEQHFLHAAVLLTRIISKPMKGRVTTDLGHKSVAAENPIDRRVYFLNLEDYKVISQSEEHLVAEVSDADWEKLKVGDVLYGIPYHICPTVALYDEVQVVEDGVVTQQWQVTGRRKKITI